jgi:hypothetical protein
VGVGPTVHVELDYCGPASSVDRFYFNGFCSSEDLISIAGLHDQIRRGWILLDEVDSTEASRVRVRVRA